MLTEGVGSAVAEMAAELVAVMAAEVTVVAATEVAMEAAMEAAMEVDATVAAATAVEETVGVVTEAAMVAAAREEVGTVGVGTVGVGTVGVGTVEVARVEATEVAATVVVERAAEVTEEDTEEAGSAAVVRGGEARVAEETVEETEGVGSAVAEMAAAARAVALVVLPQAAGWTRDGRLLWNPQRHRQAARPVRMQSSRASSSAGRTAAGEPARCSEPAGPPLVVARSAVSFGRATLAMREPTSASGHRAGSVGKCRLSAVVGRSCQLPALASLVGETDATKNSLAAVRLHKEQTAQGHSSVLRCDPLADPWVGVRVEAGVVTPGDSRNPTPRGWTFFTKGEPKTKLAVRGVALSAAYP